MYVDLKLDEVDRGKIALGQDVKIRVDSIPDKEFTATLDFIAPAAALTFTGVGADMSASTDKNFPARATLKNLDDRLRPGTSATAEIIIERQPNTLMIPLQSQLRKGGKPAVYVQNGEGLRRAPDPDRQAQRRRPGGDRRAAGRRHGGAHDPVKLAKQAKKKI